MKPVLGVDPGIGGGLAIRGHDFVIVRSMPLRDGDLDLEELSRWLRAHSEEIPFAYLEEAGMRRKQSLQVTHRSGRNFGVMEGVLAGSLIPFEVVRPQTWSSHYDHGVTEKDIAKRYRAIKIARKKIAAQMFPGVDLRENSRCSTAHEGIVDALLIADYGYRLKGQE